MVEVTLLIAAHQVRFVPHNQTEYLHQYHHYWDTLCI